MSFVLPFSHFGSLCAEAETTNEKVEQVEDHRMEAADGDGTDGSNRQFPYLVCRIAQKMTNINKDIKNSIRLTQRVPSYSSGCHNQVTRSF